MNANATMANLKPIGNDENAHIDGMSGIDIRMNIPVGIVEHAATTAKSDMSTGGIAISAMQGHLFTVEQLRHRARRILQCVINLHIDILVLESNVSQMLNDVKTLRDDLEEVQRLDKLIETLKNYNGPTICHEWPYELIFKGTIDHADMAQILNNNINKNPIITDINIKSDTKIDQILTNSDNKNIEQRKIPNLQ